MDLWQAHNEWQGKTIVCIAGGSSLTDEQCAMVSHLPTIGVNDAYRRAKLDILYACDYPWWKHYNGVPEFTGLKITPSVKAAKEFGLQCVKLDGYDGLNKTPGHVCGGGNSGYQALNIAYHLKPARVILLGYDMKGDHWFTNRPAKFKKNAPLTKFVQNFKIISREIKRENIEVVNCSPDTALNCFEQMNLADVL